MACTTLCNKLQQGDEVSKDELQALSSWLGTDKMKEIPHLNRSYLHRYGDARFSQQGLVRCVGMVQDMLEPEYYVEQHDGQFMHFRDPSPLSVESEPVNLHGRLAERQPLLVVPLPHTSQWFVDHLNPSTSTSTVSASTPLKTVESSPRSVLIPESPPTNADSTAMLGQDGDSSRKRQRDGDTSESSPRDSRNPKLDAPMDQGLLGQESDWWPAGCCQSPAEQCPVLAKFYYDQYPESPQALRLNDVVEMIGYISMDPFQATFAQDDAEDMFLMGDPIPPPSRLPRLHVLAFRPCDLDEMSIVPTQESDSTMGDDSESTLLQQFLQECTNVDASLAEILFLTLVAKSERTSPSNQMKRAPHDALGCASLQLHCSNANSSLLLFEQLKAFLSETTHVVAVMDGFALLSKPSKMTGRLEPNNCQLPKGSTILLHLGSREIPTNTRMFLDELLGQHRINYQFEGGMEVPFEADYRIVVITAPTSSQYKVPCTLRMELSDATATKFPESQSSLSQVRHLLSKGCQNVGNVDLPSTVLEQAQEDFLQRRVQARKGNDPKQPGEADFHRWLTLTRLFARTRSSATASNEDWRAALRLDDIIST
eukprot:Nitzschia sp. Nitz4//scaffold107_size73032//69758//71548//NITZ4_005773-RA/size73032-processed-gene-0.116-mRNA-1//1//CDS//3329532632//5912//frame0